MSLTVNNREYTAALADPESLVYREFEQDFCSEVSQRFDVQPLTVLQYRVNLLQYRVNSHCMTTSVN